MNHQTLSEIFFVQEIDLAGLDRSELTRTMQEICVGELRAHLEDSLCVRDLGLNLHRFDIAAAPAATLTGWVERLGDHDVVFRVVAAANGAEIADVSMTFELVPAATLDIPDAAPPDLRATHPGPQRDVRDTRGNGVLRAEVLQ